MYGTAKLDLDGLLAIKQGASYTLEIDLTDDDGNPISLTGATVAAQLRRSLSATQAVDFSIATPGSIILSLAPATTALLTTGVWQWDLFITFPDDTVWCPVEGEAVVKGAVTRG